jgi:hypothetical protein
MPFAISFPTWWGLLLWIISNLAHLFSVSEPLDAPTKREYLSLPWRLFFSTWSARIVGIFLHHKFQLTSNTPIELWSMVHPQVQQIGSTHLGYPTPVKPDQPTYAPLGKSWIRSSGCAILLRRLGLWIRDFRAAEATGGAIIASTQSSTTEIQMWEFSMEERRDLR